MSAPTARPTHRETRVVRRRDPVVMIADSIDVLETCSDVDAIHLLCTRVMPTTTADEMSGRIRASFARQHLMRTIGAELIDVKLGEVGIALRFRDDLTQQHGYLHAAVVTAIVDSACGYAALTMMPPEVEVLSVEFKVNLLAPAAGERFVAVGRVVRSGRTLSVCAGECTLNKASH